MLNITTNSGTPLEEQGREQLERLLSSYDLARWFFTSDIVVRSFVAPHSHPVLTLNTRQLDETTAASEPSCTNSSTGTP